MSLKQECLDMIHLIVDPLNQHDYDYYDIEADSYRDICDKDGNDVTYDDCSHCDCEKEDCPHKQCVKVDVSFYDGADFTRNYIFSKPQKNPCEGITYIRSRKGLMKEMLFLKKEIENYKDWCAEFGEHYSDYIEYAKEFGEQIKNDFSFEADGEKHSVFDRVNTDILPIVFHTSYAKRQKLEDTFIVTGDLNIHGNQNVINIYFCMDAEEQVKGRIRHEILHYFLYVNNMKYSDDSAIFHTLCRIYDAGAYKDMPADEQKIYDMLEVAFRRAEELLKYKDISEMQYRMNNAAMLYAVGDVKSGDEEIDKKTYENGMCILKIMSGQLEEVAVSA